MRQINIGLLGYGVVNTGVHDIIKLNHNNWKVNFGLDVNVIAIAVKHPEKHPQISEYLIDGYDLCINDDIDIIIEAISENCHLDWILDGLKLGKHVITANKQLVASHFNELIRTAEEHNVNFYYEASVGGGLPIIDLILKQKVIQDITEVRGVFNGTCNYVISQVEKGVSFKKAIQEAIENGFAEADPSLDLTGYDSAFKILIISQILTNLDLSLSDIKIEGIDDLTEDKVYKIFQSSTRIKLVARYSSRLGLIEVKPEILPPSDPLYWLENEENGIVINGSNTGEIFIKGKGAGRYPTANAMIQNLVLLFRKRLEVRI